MKLALVLDNGTIADVIEGVDEFDLSKPLAQKDLLSDIICMIQRAKPDEAEQERAATMARHPAGKGRS